ncbi:hypothetical protein Tsubulata_039554 [Turnera subulata]|uniref:Uncharacterized protein n=1 Tax=Turnera subulata TaxID=218843 RepID=A0A9Q0JI55_9ROSI|nr:hypothetical protein Tsubulata_039554 [Turnera subulata]
MEVTMLMGARISDASKEAFIDCDYAYKAFLHEFNLYEQGKKSKHDLYCEMANFFQLCKGGEVSLHDIFCDVAGLFKEHQDLLVELKVLCVKAFGQACLN